MVVPANQNSVFADGVLEPIRGVVQFDIAAGPSLAANVTRRMFVDAIGQSQAGGITLVQGDYNISGGYIPSGIGYEAHGLSFYVYQTNYIVPTDATILALGANIWVQMYYANNYYDLGMLSEYLAPWGSPTGMGNSIYPRRFGWPWNEDERPIELEPGKQFWLEFKTLRAIDAVAAVGSMVIRGVMLARKIAQGVAAVKQ